MFIPQTTAKTPLSGDTKKTDMAKQINYDILNLSKIPIGLWVTPPAKFATAKAYMDIAKSGINFINGFEWSESSLRKIKRALKFSEEAALKFLVSDSKVTKAIDKYYSTNSFVHIKKIMARIRRYSFYPSYAGQLLKDEPNYKQLSALKDIVSEYTKTYESNQWHVNMFPNYAQGGIGSDYSYEQYVEDWLQLTEPNYYSYDSYPLLQSDGMESEIEDYFYNLDLLRYKTTKRTIPLWSFIQTLGISGTPGVPDKRTPSQEDIRWQVFTNLAFGVKGIQYFCYWTPSDTAESFTDAMVDKNGNKTKRYYYIRDLNNEFEQWGKILLHSHSAGILFNGKTEEKRHELYKAPLTSFANIIGAEGDAFIAGCFTHSVNDKNSILIVAPSPRESINLTLNFAPGTEYVQAHIKGVKQKVKIDKGRLEVHIASGDALFIELN